MSVCLSVCTVVMSVSGPGKNGSHSRCRLGCGLWGMEPCIRWGPTGRGSFGRSYLGVPTVSILSLIRQRAATMWLPVYCNVFVVEYRLTVEVQTCTYALV